jgi:GT2 family glycosyltransferase
MIPDPDVSIIIVNWNTREDLLCCLASVGEEVRGVTGEVIVVDNGSGDGSAEAVRRAHPQVIVIENEGNLGFARATNQGLRRMKGRYALLLNPDTRLKAGAVERLVSFMDSRMEAGVAGGQLLNGDGSRQNSIANLPTLATELLNKSLLRRLFPDRYPGKELRFPGPIEVESVIGACMLVRRAAMDAVGLLDEGYFLFLEETDWCCRMRLGGWKVFHVPDAELYHLQGRSAESSIAMAKVEYCRSRYRYFRKHYGPVSRAVLRAGLIIRIVVDLAGSSAGTVLTLSRSRRWRRRFRIHTALAAWHLRGCPEGVGLSRPLEGRIAEARPASRKEDR